MDPTLPKNDRGGSINENVPGWTILLIFRANLWAASGRYRAAEIHPSIVAAIRRSELKLRCVSQHINEIVGSVSQIRNVAVKSFTSSVERPGALAITAVTTPKIGSTTVTMPKIKIGTGKLDAIRGVVAETLLRIVEATPGTRWKTTGSARAIRGTRKTVKTLEIDVPSLPLIQRGIDQTTVSVLKLMMIIPGYAHFSMLRRLL